MRPQVELLSLPHVVRPESGGLWRTLAGLNWTKPDSPASAKSVY